MMPRYYLTRLTIEGFRGVNNENNPLDIKFQADAVNSVFAANGIGKSSIFEALCYGIHGTIPKLQQLQAQERPQDYYCNRFHSRNTASIVMEFQPDDGTSSVSIQVKRDEFGNRTVTSPSGHRNPEEILAMFKEAFALLDYRTFARFIEESPLERGRTFSALLGFSQYSDCRQALQAVSDTRVLNSDLEKRVISAKIIAAQKASQQALISLRSSYENVTGKSLEDIAKLDEYVEDITAALGNVNLLTPHINGKSLDAIDFEKIKEVIKIEEGGEKRRELAKTIESIAALEALTAYELKTITADQESIGTMVDEREELLESTHGDLYKRLYESAQEIYSKDTWVDNGKCPLCDSELSISITEHVNTKLDQYRMVAEKTSEISEKWQESDWRNYLIALESAPTLQVDLHSQITLAMDTKFSSGDISKVDLTTIEEFTSDLSHKLICNISSLTKKKEVLDKELPPSLVQLTEQIGYGQLFKDALILYRKHNREEVKQQSRLDVRERWSTFISSARQAFSDSEAILVQARIKSIDKQYKSMFGAIMKIGDVVPDLYRADDSENLHVQLSDFHGQQKLSARALLSESYRNALAISVFLAAALKHSGAPRFIVLDDVTSSFDSGHQFWLMELIRTKLQQPENPDGLQFIILSHDGLLEKYFDRLGEDSHWHHNKLQGSPPMGEILHQIHGANHLRSTITSLLSAGQVKQAEPLIRQYFEYKLQQIIRKVNIPVPLDFAIKDTSRMVNNCIKAISSAIELHSKAETIVLETQQIQDFTNTYIPTIVGNWFSHYETSSGSNFSAQALMGVLTAIDELEECFKYDESCSERRWYKALDRR